MKQSEVIKEAEYLDVILSLLSEPYQIVSVTKITFMAFCIYHEKNLMAYNRRKKDFVDIFFQNISLKLSVDYKDIERIMSVLDILVNTKKIIINEDRINIVGEINHSPENEFMKYCMGKVPNPIIEIDKLDATAVLEEVIRYV